MCVRVGPFEAKYRVIASRDCVRMTDDSDASHTASHEIAWGLQSLAYSAPVPVPGPAAVGYAQCGAAVSELQHHIAIEMEVKRDLQ